MIFCGSPPARGWRCKVNCHGFSEASRWRMRARQQAWTSSPL